MKGNGESLEWKLFLASFPLCSRAVAQNPLAAQRSQIVWGPTTPVGVRRLLRMRCDDLPITNPAGPVRRLGLQLLKLSL